MNLVENQFGHGSLDISPDARDYKYHRVNDLGSASIPFDWNMGFDIQLLLQQKTGNPQFDLYTENQGQSFSCGGQALRYYLEALKTLKDARFDRLSAKDPYCQIFYPGGGTDIRSIGKLAVQKGIKEESIIPSYDNGVPPSEIFMEDKTLSNATPLSPKFKEFAFAFPKVDIESVALALRDNNGCIIQVSGQNNGTWLSTMPTPPITRVWSHFLYAGKARVINGKKYIGVKNSWGNIGSNGWQWLSEDFFNGAVTNCLVLYDSTLYNYTPSLTQSTLTWLQKFLQFFNAYK